MIAKYGGFVNIRPNNGIITGMKKSEKTFEESVRELDDIVEQMESGNLPLDGMIDSYRRGAKLVRHGRDKLTAARAEIKKLEKDELMPVNDGDNG